MTWLLDLVSPYMLWLKIASYALVFGAGFGSSSYIHNHSEMKKEIVEQKAVIVLQEKRADVSVKVAEKGRKKTASIDAVFNEREQEIQKHEDAKGTEGGAVGAGGGIGLVLQRTVCLWDSANKGEGVPPAGCLDNEAPSDVTHRDIEKQHDREASLALRLEEHVRELEDWICAQALLHNGTRAPFEVCQAK